MRVHMSSFMLEIWRRLERKRYL